MTLISLPGGGKPSGAYRTAFGPGMSGWDVWALQVALNGHQQTFPIAEDGVIAADPKKSETIQCILREQGNHHLKVDGVCGPATQRAIALAEIKKAEAAHNVKPGLLHGLANGESSLLLVCVSGPNWNGSFDAGLIQDNITTSQAGDIAAWRKGFNPRVGCDETAAKLRKKFTDYKGKAGAKTDRAAWEAALVFHNWQSAADQMAAGTFDSWVYYAYNADGEGRWYGVDDDAYWVIAASRGRLSTGREWRDDYVRRNTIYCSW